jgi:hypothetical protein
MKKSKMNKEQLREYVHNMELGLSLLSKIPFKNPKSAAVIASVLLILKAAKNALEEQSPPSLVLIEGGQSAD